MPTTGFSQSLHDETPSGDESGIWGWCDTHNSGIIRWAGILDAA
jgi:hypothetical protein